MSIQAISNLKLRLSVNGCCCFRLLKGGAKVEKKGRTCKTDLDVIQKALDYREESNMGWADIARKFGCSEQTLYYYKRKQKQNI